MDIEQRLQKIEERNAKVEADKAWETSWARRLILAALTYIVAALFLRAIGVPNYLLSALVPTGGFLISSLTMPLFKSLWLKDKK
jgi:hypothetical protein